MMKGIKVIFSFLISRGVCINENWKKRYNTTDATIKIILFQCCQSQLDEVKVGIDLYCCAELSEKKLLCLAS